MNKLIYNLKPKNNILNIDFDDAVIQEILNFVNKNFIQVINEVSIIFSSNSDAIMLIYDLKKDQRHKIRELTPKMPVKIDSAYIYYKNIYSLVFGEECIFDSINNYKINIFPNSTYFDTELKNLYNDILFLSPTGKTRSAIVFNSQNGIIPIHISTLYNKVYSIDEDLNFFKNSKINFKINRLNNILTFNMKYIEWMNKFIDGDYNIPGKKFLAGNFILNADQVNATSIEFISHLKPETILVYGKESNPPSIENYIISKEINSFDNIIYKYRVANERIS